ncbi:hypothetical protein KXX11_009470 [Aspergillus fumigatus]|nr:hypothetical protein KXX11_009470 [Aspergillus fumigatus]KAH1855713.1 hypothetical protein KXX55_007163 [Aspergillus fumigatus]KAH2083433.1 hypothetical protein KXW32_005761 [Aspergillus fumigatus]KAH2089280.1 hypothetical protein KXX03_005623 [Aspergillus fumigatus]KAH2271006.1 hypothetical protein KXW96_006560 [Aspergillus fumigatus]
MAKESSYLLKHYLKLVNELRELKQANDSKEFSLKERADEYSGYGLKRVPTPYPLMARN